MDEIFKMKDDVLNASELLNERSGKLNSVNDKAGNLAETSTKYRTLATKVKKSTVKRKVIISVGIVAAVLVIGYFIVVMACGWNFKCKGD